MVGSKVLLILFCQLLIHPHQLRHTAHLGGGGHIKPIRLHDGLWLKGVSPKELKSMPLVMQRVAKCKETRNNSVAAAIRRFIKQIRIYIFGYTPLAPIEDYF